MVSMGGWRSLHAAVQEHGGRDSALLQARHSGIKVLLQGCPLLLLDLQTLLTHLPCPTTPQDSGHKRLVLKL